MQLRRQALSGATWTGVAALASALCQFVQIAVLARLLRAEDFGLMALVMLVVGFAQAFADMGLSGAIIHRQDATREVLSSVFWLNVVAGMLLCVALALAAPLVAVAFGQPELRKLVALAALTFLVTPVSQQFYALLQKSLAFKTLAGIDLLTALCSVAAAIASALMGQGVYAFIWGTLVAAAMRATVLLGIGMRRWRPALRFRAAELRGYVRFGAYQTVERSINFLGFNLDKLLVGSLIGVHGLGLYSVAYQLAMKPVLFFAPVVNRVALPLFAVVQKDDARLRSGFLDCMRAVSLIMFPLYAGMIVLAEPLVRVVLGEAWRSTVPVLQLLAALGFFYSIGNPIGSLLVAKGRIALSFLLNVWMLVLYACAIFLGSAWGVEGVATALVVATACGLFPSGFLVRWLLVRMRPPEYLRALAPALLASIVMAACVVGVRGATRPTLGPPAELVAFTLFGALTYLALMVPWQRKFLIRLRDTLR
jgi:lipopolysaccharide exporter